MEEHLYNLTALGSKPGLERIGKLLISLGNPEANLKCVHVAGTNGKGSTSYIIANILQKAGYRVGRFTSPHVHSYRERFTLNGEAITAIELKTYLDKIESLICQKFRDDAARPTEFEVLTAIAFRWFEDKEVDIVLLEVGMGGIYDSTNVVIPEVSVITSIGLDHTSFLGNNLAEIAYNKAGIIKRQIPIVVGDIPKEALEVIEKIALQNDAPIYMANKDILEVRDEDLSGYNLDINWGEDILENTLFTLLGTYQLDNLATALTVINLLIKQGYKVSLDNIRNGLGSTKMPGRLEVVSQNPLVVLDVCHNEEGARAVSNALLKLLPDKSRVMVCGIVDDKDAYSILKYLGQNTSKCIITRPEGRRGYNWDRLLPVWEELYPDILVTCEEDIKLAVKYALSQLNGKNYLLICGSFYIIDQARRLFTAT